MKVSPAMLQVLHRYEDEFVWLDPASGRYRWASRYDGEDVEWANRAAVQRCLDAQLIEVGYLRTLTAKGREVLAQQEQEQTP